jgi:hypothetical protein
MSRTRKPEEDGVGDLDEVDVLDAEEPEEVPGPGDPYEALVVIPPPDEPVEELTAEAAPEEAPLKAPAGHVALVYRGAADTYFAGDYLFRPDQPVIVPSDVAEELLTTPFERFETV